MKGTKKLISILLILLMLFQSIPLVYATDNLTDYDSESETSIYAENGMGQIIENLTETQQEEENAYTGGYSILDLTFENGIAYVDVNVASQCTLVVAIYDENTAEMLYSATEKLDTSVFSEDIKHDIISVDMSEAEIPSHFLIKAFILDENNNALCKNFVCRTYTSAYEIFMATTPDDFAGKEIVNLDYSNDDFGVLVDNAVVSEQSDTMTYTYSNGIYTFFNASEEVKNLKTGDIFYYQLSDEIGDFLLIKVKEISVDGTTVKITEDEEIALGDAFQFFRIDEDADFSDVELTEENLGSALSLQEQEKQRMFMSPRAEVDTSYERTFSTTLDVSYPNSEEENKEAWEKGWEIKGSFGYSISAKLKLYYDIRSGDDFYEFTTSLTHEVSLDVTFSGKIESNPNYFSIDFPTIPIGVFNLDISVYPVLSAEASMKFGCTIEIYNNISFTDGNGLTKINDTKWLGGEPTLGETEIEFKFGIGVEFDIGFKKGKQDIEGLSKLHASLSASFEGGIKAKFKPSLIGVLLDKHHNCGFCLTGSISAFLNGKATLKFKIINENLKWSWEAISLTDTWTVGDCYFSISENGVKFGMGTCPYISHKVTVFVYDENGEPVKETVVSTTTGYCDADGDKKFNETSMLTDENGQAVFYFSQGKHEIVAEKNGIGTSGQQFEMLAMEKEINLELFDAQYFNGHWYKVFTDKKTWEDAKTYCENLGGHLVTITSQAENNFILGLISPLVDLKFSIGFTDKYNEGEWQWITNEAVCFTNWGNIQPDNHATYDKDGQDYATIVSKDLTSDSCNCAAGEWDDVSDHIDAPDSDYKKSFICEWESIPTSRQAMTYRMSPYRLTVQEEDTDNLTVNGKTAMRTDALKDTEYVLAVVKDENAEELLSVDNLFYIDQKTAESSTISFDFVLPEGITDYTVKIFGISHSHTETTIKGYPATCTATGLTDGVKCAVCGDILTEQQTISVSEHIDTNGDYTCDFGCGFEFEKAEQPENPVNTCSHICHKDGFLGYIWKILNFFNRLFRINNSCDCGINHW